MSWVVSTSFLLFFIGTVSRYQVWPAHAAERNADAETSLAILRMKVVAQESANRLRTTACFMGCLHERWRENRPR